MTDVYDVKIKKHDDIAYISDFNRHGHQLTKAVVMEVIDVDHVDIKNDRPHIWIKVFNHDGGEAIEEQNLFVHEFGLHRQKMKEGETKPIVSGWAKVYITHKSVMVI